jgi:hypothetical protein
MWAGVRWGRCTDAGSLPMADFRYLSGGIGATLPSAVAKGARVPEDTMTHQPRPALRPARGSAEWASHRGSDPGTQMCHQILTPTGHRPQEAAQEMSAKAACPLRLGWKKSSVLT